MQKAIHELSLYISKASSSDGKMRWTATSSDTDWDLYGERMSIPLFQKMISNINLKSPPPEQFKSFVVSDYWQGGMPYLSIAHYSDGNGKAVPGEVHELFIDGKKLKAKGILYDTPLGNNVWKSLKEDENKPLNDDNRIRISIGFLDLRHSHDNVEFFRKSLSDACPQCLRGFGQKTYLDGYLVHLALTRVPVNTRTIMEVEKSMAKKSVTKRGDALSIVQDEALVEEIVQADALAAKSDVLVEFSDSEEAPVEEVVAVEKSDGEPTMYMPYGGATSLAQAKEYENAQEESWRVSKLYYAFTDVAGNIMCSEYVTDKAAALGTLTDEFKSMLVSKSVYEEMVDGGLAPIPFTREDGNSIMKSLLEELASVKAFSVDNSKLVEDVAELKSLLVSKPSEVTEKSALDVSVDNLYNVVKSMVASPASFEERLQTIQPVLEELGESIRVTVRSVDESAPPPARPDVNDAVLEAVQALSHKIEGMGVEISTLKAQSAPIVNNESRVPVPRSVSPQIVKSLSQEAPKNTGSVRDVVRRSVGL